MSHAAIAAALTLDGISTPERLVAFSLASYANQMRLNEGWNADRVKRLVDHYEGMSDEELADEDEAASPAQIPPPGPGPA